jgi:predicted DNA-binding transcriptional regulator AlpA
MGERVDGNRGARSLANIVDWLKDAPPATTIEAHALREMLEPLVDAPAVVEPGEPAAPSMTWRERLWTAPAETRIGVTELAEAVGRSKYWVYRLTPKSAGAARLPHRKLSGEVEFVVGEIRSWLRDNEEMVEKGRMDVVPIHRPTHPRRAS